MKYEKEILHKLLDKYERTDAGRQGQVPVRSIALVLYGKKTDLAYDITDTAGKEEMHRAAERLQENGWVKRVWHKHAAGQILAKIVLIPEAIPEIYIYLKRVPAHENVEAVYAQLTAVQKQLVAKDWAWLYIQDQISYIESRKRVPAAMVMEMADRTKWLDCLVQADNLRETVTERAFSMRFSDSKAFEREYKNRLAGIVQKYVDETLSTAQALEMIGIVRYPETIDFAGPLQLTRHGITVDVRAFDSGIAAACKDLLVSDLNGKDIRQITSIENKASYLEYIQTEKREDELVLYHGGQTGPERTKAFQAVRRACPHAGWRHWSDIDYGGLLMLARLRKNVDGSIEAFRMDIASLERYRDEAALCKETYRQKLRSLKTYQQLRDQTDLIDYMADHGLRLEQEAFINHKTEG